MAHNNEPWELTLDLIDQAGNKRIFELPDSGRITLGRSIHCDVVVRQLADVDASIALTCERPVVRVSVLSGTVTVGSVNHGAGDSFSLSSAGMSVGKMQLGVEGVRADEAPVSEINANEVHTRELDTGGLDANGIDSNGLDSNGLGHGSLDTPIENPPPTEQSLSDSTLSDSGAEHSNADKWWRKYAAMGAACAVTLSVVMMGWQVSASSKVQGVDSNAMLADFINQPDFNTVELSSEPDGSVLTGWLNQRSDLLKLENFVNTQRVDVEFKVMDGQSIRTQVEDLFRINGVEALAEFDDSGMLWVNTAVADTASLEPMRAAVSSDIPALTQWDIANIPPEDLTPAGPEDPGKEVAMVVSDEPAFVLTVDQSRYFVGSVLPTGHKISAIESGRVLLVKDGKQSELQF